MIEPEIALADLADNARLAEALLEYTFAALLKDREEDLAFFESGSRRARRETGGGRQLRIGAHGLGRGDRGPRADEREVRISGQVGRRPAVGARTLTDRKTREEGGHRDEV
jgi:hypothetical protein